MNRWRRTALTTIAASPLAILALAQGQQPARTWRIGFLSARRRPASLEADYYASFLARLGELGYREGRNLVVDWRFAGSDYELLPKLAEELVQSRVDAMVAAGPPAAHAAKHATPDVPIVFVVSSDPVASGLVASLAQPGRNVTGIANLAGDLASKHVELLLPIVPSLGRLGLLVNPENPAHEGLRANLDAAARGRGLALVAAEARAPAQIELAFAGLLAARSDAVLVALDPMFIQQTPQIAALAKRHRLPSIASLREFAEAGGLMSYGQNQAEIYRRVADYIDRILKGTPPGRLPVQQPTRLELVVNLRTAREMSIAVPASLLIAADAVLE